MEENFKGVTNHTNEDDHFDDKLLEPYYYLTRIPGKKIRTKLIQSFNYWLNIPEDVLNKITEVIEMLHNSSLLIDDIEDNSQLRRGIPVAHQVYGVPLTINSANYAYFIALKKVVELNNPETVRIFSDQLIELHRGQGMEIWYRDNFVCPNENEYKTLVDKKTGGLFKLAIDLMNVYSEKKLNFDHLIYSIGLFFQIRDDLANLCSKEYADSKSYCEDLTEGKFSFPIIHFMKTYPNDSTILELKRQAVRILEESGCFEFTINYLRSIKDEIFNELNKFNGNPFLEKMLTELCKLID